MSIDDDKTIDRIVEDDLPPDLPDSISPKKSRRKLSRRKKIAFCYCPLILVILVGATVANWDLVFRLYYYAGEYPYKSHITLQNEAQEISDNLQTYITGWINGINPPEIPDSLLPPGIDLQMTKDYYLQEFDDINPSEQWGIRPSQPIDFDAILGGLPDPHVTYLLLGTSFAPFGVKLMIEGQFPYCRFFSMQITAPFDGKTYTIGRTFGPAENSIADVDIDPDVGSINPFRIGEDRYSLDRNYTMEFRLAMGDPLTLDPNFKPPYRGAGNIRYGSFIVNQGPAWHHLAAKGPWNHGLFWIRYYAPDDGKDYLAGVNLPKAYYIDPDSGVKYYINSNFTQFENIANAPHAAEPNAPVEPLEFMGPNHGWGKSFGILRNILTGIFVYNSRATTINMEYVRKMDLYATGRGQYQTGPGNYEKSATENNYSPYVGHGMNLGSHKVVVLTGIMPTFPDTRPGVENMSAAQVRYWSIGGYDQSIFRMGTTMTGCLFNVMDDEVKLDATRHYMIVISRLEDRPSNANEANNITWINWGPLADLGILMRWVTVSPEWDFPQSPDQTHLSWAVSDRASLDYDPTMLDTNDQTGFMGEYLPKRHYMTKPAFEGLGTGLTYEDIPEWVNLEGNA